MANDSDADYIASQIIKNIKILRIGYKYNR